MTRGALAIGTLISVVLFPWPLTALLALFSAIYLPLLPLAAGAFSDVLYWTPVAGASSVLPFGTLAGLLVSALALFVRSRLNAGIIGE